MITQKYPSYDDDNSRPRQEVTSLSQRKFMTVNEPEPVPAIFEQDKSDDDEIDLRQLWSVIRRRRAVIFTLFILITLITLIFTLSITPIYRAGVTMEINQEEQRLLDYDVAANDSQRSSVNSKDFYQTHYELLKSRSLADRVISNMGIEDKLRGTQEQLAKPFYADWLEAFSTEETAQDAAEVKGERPLADKFLANVTISPVKNSKIVNIQYDDASPEFAANAANAIAQNYINMNLERRAGTTRYAEQFLQEQLVLTKSKLEESEAKLADYAKQADILDINNENMKEQRLSGLSNALATAERDRISAETKYSQVKSADMASAVLASTTIQTLKKALTELEVRAQSVSSSTTINDPTIQRLEQEKAKLEADYQEKLEIYKPDYPLMVQLEQKINKIDTQLSKASSNIRTGIDQQIAELKTQIQQETRNIQNALKSDYLEAQQKEDELRAEMQTQVSGVQDLRDKRITYNTLNREVETNRNVYEGLLQRLKEVGVASGAVTNNIAVVDAAIVPYAVHTPNKKLNLALGAVLGLFIGVVAAFLLEFLDDRIKTKEDIERLLPLPLLGIAPAIGKRSKGSADTEYHLMTAEQPTSAVAEAFRSLRTNLMFATRTGAPRIMNVTSAGPAEGKSSAIINLATAFAQAGKKVLIIDGDLRKPTIHKRFKLDNSQGFVHFLTGQEKLEALVKPTLIPNVFAIPSGPIPPNPVELLSSEHLHELTMRAENGQLPYDLVMIDAPPVLGLADALIIGNHTRATLLITAYNETRKQPLHSAYERLRQARSHLLGVVLTKAKSAVGDSNYYSYDYYYSYGAGESSEGDGRTPKKKALTGKKAA
ncbi:MAG: polysaccharide biosynthesis tyrosine autokinase [Candidatus Thiothrix sulfatifontis]|nr:MAG: polysaccharide biosynthesis tyrosine autokinase [Candidatus Thiothrix sulfatifontis]